MSDKPKRMTVAEAAEVLEKQKAIVARAEPKIKAARKRMIEHFEKTGTKVYKNKILFGEEVRTDLDTDKVKEELGDRLPEFQKQTTVKKVTVIK